MSEEPDDLSDVSFTGRGLPSTYREFVRAMLPHVRAKGLGPQATMKTVAMMWRKHKGQRGSGLTMAGNGLTLAGAQRGMGAAGTVSDVAGGIGTALGVAGVAAGATGIGLVATPFLEAGATAAGTVAGDRLQRRADEEDEEESDPDGILVNRDDYDSIDTDDESDTGESSGDDDPAPVPAPTPAPAPVAAQPGAAAVAVTRQLDLVARAEAADALRRTPGIMKLIEARIFKFDDFLTNGSLDPRKLDRVWRVLAKRVDSTAESYKLAASARGYAPSGVAFPIEGINNIVAGVRKVPGSQYVMYQGPQYVNG